MSLSEDDRGLADAATQSLLSTYASLCAALGGRAFSRIQHGVASFVSGGQIPSLNVVAVLEPSAHVDTIARLLDEVVATGLPHCVQVRPAAMESVMDLVTGRGKARQEDVPLMVRAGGVSPENIYDGLTIRDVLPGQMNRHVAVAAAGFEASEDLFAEVMTDQLLEIPGWRCYLGEVAGEPVTTGIGVLTDGLIGVFNVATPPPHRRLGYGGALTARIVTDGIVAGARGAYLQSSAAGHDVYQRLGFRTVEHWSMWT